MNLEAAYLYWGREDESCITPATGLSGGEYFKLSTQEIKYAVWTSVNSVGTDPTVVGYTSIEVAVSTAYTVAEWIAAFKIAIEAVEFIADASTDGLSVKTTTLNIGAPLEAITDVDTSFTFENTTVGIGGDLGKTKDAIELSMEITTLDVNANQTGETLLDKIITGTKASLSASLLEMTNAKWELIVGQGYGDSKVFGSDTLVGFGDSKVNLSAFGQAGKLILHPVRLVATDRTRDVVFHKCVPLPESINFDGTDTQTMTVGFEAFVDETKASEINVFSFGDWKQDLR